MQDHFLKRLTKLYLIDFYQTLQLLKEAPVQFYGFYQVKNYLKRRLLLNNINHVMHFCSFIQKYKLNNVHRKCPAIASSDFFRQTADFTLRGPLSTESTETTKTKSGQQKHSPKVQNIFCFFNLQNPTSLKGPFCFFTVRLFGIVAAMQQRNRSGIESIKFRGSSNVIFRSISEMNCFEYCKHLRISFSKSSLSLSRRSQHGQGPEN